MLLALIECKLDNGQMDILEMHYEEAERLCVVTGMNPERRVGSWDSPARAKGFLLSRNGQDLFRDQVWHNVGGE